MKPRKLCRICNENSTGPKSNTCKSCGQWWRYHTIQSSQELGVYIERVERASTRLHVFTRSARKRSA
jgi:hypothetical protein